jgi:hypothetical protein
MLCSSAIVDPAAGGGGGVVGLALNDGFADPVDEVGTDMSFSGAAVKLPLAAADEEDGMYVIMRFLTSAF